MMVGELQNRDAAHAGSSIVMALILLPALYSFLASRRYFISGKQILQKRLQLIIIAGILRLWYAVN